MRDSHLAGQGTLVRTSADRSPSRLERETNAAGPMPLFLPAVGFLLGVAGQGFWPLGLGEAALGALAMATIALCARRLGRSAGSQYAQRLSKLAMVLSLGLAGAGWSSYRQPDWLPVLDASPQEAVVLSGCVVIPSVHSERREQFTVELMPGALARVTLPLALGEAGPALRYGQRVEFPARVRRPTNFRNPGGFDWVGYLSRRDVYWTASVPAGEEPTILPGQCGGQLEAWLFAARGWTLRRIQELYPNGDRHSAMLQALLLGDATQVEQTWTEVFRRTGTYHALVLSGYHLTAMFLLLRLLLSLSWFLIGRLGHASPHLGRGMELLVGWRWFRPVQECTRYLGGMLLLWGYTLLALSPMPLLRASAAVTLYMAGQLLFRRLNPLQLLGVCTLGILLADPNQVFDGSFHFTMLSMLCLLGLAEPFFGRQIQELSLGCRDLWNDRLHASLPQFVQIARTECKLFLQIAGKREARRQRWTPAFLVFAKASLVVAGLFFTSLAMQLGLSIPSMVFFHRLPWLSAVANVPVAGLLSLAVPVGFLAAVTKFSGIAWLAATLLDWATTLGTLFAAYETVRVPDIPLPMLLLLAFLLLMAGVAGVRRHWAGGWGFLLAGLVVVGCVLYPFAPQVTTGQFEVTAIDVGQGEALLLVAPDGRTALIDAGGIPTFKGRPKPKLEIGEQVVSSYLWKRRLRRLDLLVLTHAHEDHSGGMRAVIENFRPRELWVGAMSESPVWTQVRAAARQFGVKIVAPKTGMKAEWGGVELEVLAPFPDQEASIVPHNRDSLVLRATYGRHSFLLTGDLERDIEARLQEEGRLQPVTVLKVGHHGSRTSSTEEFLAELKPSFALISSGQDNLFRHPHQQVVDRLRERHAAILRTDERGLIRILTDGKLITVRCWPFDPEERLWQPLAGW